MRPNRTSRTSRFNSWTRHFRSGEKGQVIVITAFAIVVMFGIVGLAVDVGRMYAARAELGRAVDAAALAGVLDLPNVTNAENTAEDYLEENEPGATPDIEGDAANNTLRVDASKTVNMFFIRVLGINTATVSAHAKAGFGVLSLDAALVIDATGSMDDGCNSNQNNSGCPIYEAKEAAKDFKDVLLGSSPDGNTAIGVAAVRGCYRSSAQTATAPMHLTNKDLCVRHDATSNTWVTELIYNKTTLNSRINNINAEGGSGTNVCGGLAKGWEILEGPGNHLADENSLRYLVLLSDGDNNYYGQYTYQASPASPHTYQTYSCQPPTSCSDVGGVSTSSSDPCHNGVFTNGSTTASDNFDGTGNNCPGNWSAGTGWIAAWAISPSSGNDAPTYLTSNTPYDTSCHVRMRGTGTFTRNVNVSSATSAALYYFAKTGDDWETGGSADTVNIQVSTNGTTWTTLFTHTRSNTSSGHNSFCVDLSAYAGQANLRIRFAGGMSAGSSSDNFYVDNIIVKSNTACSSDGFQNGHNGSPASCSTAVKRERQLDKETWALAKAIKADNVIIYVVGFGTCDPGSDIYTDAQCEAQIGNTDHDNTADERLLKCMASSTPGTNNRYFYAPNTSALPSIFTQIAQQIAHRLIE